MGGLFKRPKMPDQPTPEAVPVMPTPDDEAIRKVKKRSIAGQKARRGRMSTIFTDPSETLGGGY